MIGVILETIVLGQSFNRLSINFQDYLKSVKLHLRFQTLIYEPRSFSVKGICFNHLQPPMDMGNNMLIGQLHFSYAMSSGCQVRHVNT